MKNKIGPALNLRKHYISFANRRYRNEPTAIERLILGVVSVPVLVALKILKWILVLTLLIPAYTVWTVGKSVVVILIDIYSELLSDAEQLIVDFKGAARIIKSPYQEPKIAKKKVKNDY